MCVVEARTRNIIKQTKLHLLCCCHDNNFGAGQVLIKTEIPRFCLNQGSYTPNNVMRRVKTV